MSRKYIKLIQRSNQEEILPNVDACWIKTYNGLGTEGLHFYYIFQDGENRPAWNIANIATYGGGANHYVEDISEQQTP